jgi:hypothetical protein
MLGPMFRTPLKMRRGHLAVFPDQICRWPQRSRWRQHQRRRQAGEAGDELAKLHRHATRSEFLLDADAFSRNARDPHDAVVRDAALGKGWLLVTIDGTIR